MAIDILHNGDFFLGGCEGLKEHRLVMSPKLFGEYVNPGTWPGFGSFVYFSEAQLNPKGETFMHEHKEIDIISVLLEGQILHQGSLQHGQLRQERSAQVQRAGKEGFSHNEINQGDTYNRLLQLWFLPDHSHDKATYNLYDLQQGQVSRVYKEIQTHSGTISNYIVVEIAVLNADQEFTLDQPFLAYLASGKGIANKQTIKQGELFKDHQLSFKATSDLILIVIYEEEN